MHSLTYSNNYYQNKMIPSNNEDTERSQNLNFINKPQAKFNLKLNKKQK